MQDKKKNKYMESVLSHSPLDAAQLFILRTFATAETEQDKEELTSLYLDYIQRKLDVAVFKK